MGNVSNSGVGKCVMLSRRRGISRVTQISHTTILNWIREAGESLSDEPQDSEIPEITEIDELQTFVGNRKNQYWIWSVVNHKKKGIVLWAIGDRSHQTFELMALHNRGMN